MPKLFKIMIFICLIVLSFVLLNFLLVDKADEGYKIAENYRFIWIITVVLTAVYYEVIFGIKKSKKN